MPFSFLQPSYLVHRCRSELRRGNPVILLTPAGKAYLFVALDTVSPGGWENLQQSWPLSWHLVLSHYRWQYIKNRHVTADTPNKPVVIRVPSLSWTAIKSLLAVEPSFSWEKTTVSTARHVEKVGLTMIHQAGLMPVAALQPLLPEQVQEFLQHHHILAFNINDLNLLKPKETPAIEFIVETKLPLAINPDNRLLFFRETGGEAEHLALIIGTPTPQKPVLLRVHSSCLTGDVLGSLRCDCGPQLHHALQLMGTHGGGILLYLQQEGRNIGLANKLRSYRLQELGADTLDANLSLGFSADERSFQLAVGILKHLNITTISLLSNNPHKKQALEKGGIHVHSVVPLQAGKNTHNQQYLRTKKQRMGHQL